MTGRSPDELALLRGATASPERSTRSSARRRQSASLAFRLTGNEADAADVVQEAYLRAFRAIGRFRGDSSVRTWLYRIVANAASNSRRRRPAAALTIDEALDLVDLRADRDPGAVAERHEERAVIVAALGALPFGLRAVVVLRDIYDLPHDAIAAELGISRAASKVRLHRARKALAATPSRTRRSNRAGGRARRTASGRRSPIIGGPEPPEP